MEETTIKIAALEEMVEFGRALGSILEAGDVVGLGGDLGAGKTFLSSHIARALGVPDEEPVTSPTFAIINEYRGGVVPVYHMDYYRLESAEQLYELGVWEYYDSDGVCLVEWFDRFDDLWPEGALCLDIELGEGEHRLIRALGKNRGANLVAMLESRMVEVRL